MELGCVEGVTPDSSRAGTTIMFAPLEVASGELITQ
jgi:hypothetical protein